MQYLRPSYLHNISAITMDQSWCDCINSIEAILASMARENASLSATKLLRTKRMAILWHILQGSYISYRTLCTNHANGNSNSTPVEGCNTLMAMGSFAKGQDVLTSHSIYNIECNPRQRRWKTLWYTFLCWVRNFNFSNRKHDILAPQVPVPYAYRA